MPYRHNDALHRHRVRAYRFRKVALVASAIVIIVAVGIGVDWILNQVNRSETLVTTEYTKSVQSANIDVYRTEYFQFQAPESWVEVASETTNKRFVYVKNSGSLITQRLMVIVDRPETNREADVQIDRVLPITLDSNNRFNPAVSVSDHCENSWPGGLPRNPSRITHEGVSFVCTPDSRQYNVVIGEVGGDESISATTSDGRQVTIYVVYSDLTAYPSPGDIYNIISSFSIL